MFSFEFFVLIKGKRKRSSSTLLSSSWGDVENKLQIKNSKPLQIIPGYSLLFNTKNNECDDGNNNNISDNNTTNENEQSSLPMNTSIDNNPHKNHNNNNNINNQLLNSNDSIDLRQTKECLTENSNNIKMTDNTNNNNIVSKKIDKNCIEEIFQLLLPSTNGSNQSCNNNNAATAINISSHTDLSKCKQSTRKGTYFDIQNFLLLFLNYNICIK